MGVRASSSILNPNQRQQTFGNPQERNRSTGPSFGQLGGQQSQDPYSNQYQPYNQNNLNNSYDQSP